MTTSTSRTQIGIAYLTALVCMLALDGLWLTVLMGASYQDSLGSLLLERPRFGVAAVFYLLYPVGIVVFGVLPGLTARDGVASP